MPLRAVYYLSTTTVLVSFTISTLLSPKGRLSVDPHTEAFLNYSRIIVSFFGNTTPDLFFALGEFHREIIDLASIYSWQQTVLPLALDYHTSVTNSLATSVQLWEMPQRWAARYCNPLTVFGNTHSYKRQRSRSP